MSSYFGVSTVVGGVCSLAGAFYAKVQESVVNQSYKKCLTERMSSLVNNHLEGENLYKKCRINPESILKAGLQNYDLLQTVVKEKTTPEGVIETLENNIPPNPMVDMISAHCDAYIDPSERPAFNEAMTKFTRKAVSLMINDPCPAIESDAQTWRTAATALLVTAAVFGVAYFVGPWLMKKASGIKLPQMPQFTMPTWFRRTPQNPAAANAPSAAPSRANAKPFNRGLTRERTNSQPTVQTEAPRQSKPTGSVSKTHGENYYSSSSVEAEWAKRRKSVTGSAI